MGERKSAGSSNGEWLSVSVEDMDSEKPSLCSLVRAHKTTPQLIARGCVFERIVYRGS